MIRRIFFYKATIAFSGLLMVIMYVILSHKKQLLHQYFFSGSFWKRNLFGLKKLAKDYTTNIWTVNSEGICQKGSPPLSFQAARDRIPVFLAIYDKRPYTTNVWGNLTNVFSKQKLQSVYFFNINHLFL